MKHIGNILIHITLFIILGSISFVLIYLGKTNVFDPQTNPYISLETSSKIMPLYPNHYTRTFGFRDDTPIYVFANESLGAFQKDCFSKNGYHCIYMPNQEFMADLQWIRHIQYVGRNISREDTPFLLDVIETLTNMSPQRSYPYVFGQILGPINKIATISEERKKDSRTKTLSLGEKGIFFTCDDEKIAKISEMSDKNFIKIVEQTNNGLENPCDHHLLPHHLGFNSYYYLQDHASAVLYYKIAAFHQKSAQIAKRMPAIIQGQAGEHEKSMLLWFDKFISINDQLLDNPNPQDIDSLEEQLLYFKGKAIFELSLHIVQGADMASREQKDISCLQDIECLYENNFIDQKIEELNTGCVNAKNNTDDFSSNVLCLVLSLASEGGYIVSGQQFVYPLNTKEQSYSYKRHPILEKWWIMEDIME